MDFYAGANNAAVEFGRRCSGGSANDAHEPLIELPENEAAYPEMNMFGRELPAYGAYLCDVREVTCKDVRITTTKADARLGVMLIDAEGVTPADFATSSAK